MPLSVDVVLVAYNRYDLTESCLRHLSAQTREHRVIVVDNGSTDDTRERVRREWPQHDLLTVDVNQALSRSTNLGVAHGEGAVVVWVNNDVECRPDFVERVAAPLERDPRLGSVAALCVRPGGEVIDSMGLAVDVTLSAFPRLQGRPADEAVSARPVLAGPSGTAAAYRRRAWEALGGLDERLFAYSEDLDLTLRLRAAGWNTMAAPDAVGVHLGSATHGHRSAWQRRHGGFGRGYLVRRYGLLGRRTAPRTAFTEALVVAGDAVISRDAAALRGRLAGWRAARRLPARKPPPPAAIDTSIGLRDSIDLRRGVYARDTR